jgi:hypothetical protein
VVDAGVTKSGLHVVGERAVEIAPAAFAVAAEMPVDELAPWHLLPDIRRGAGSRGSRAAPATICRSAGQAAHVRRPLLRSLVASNWVRWPVNTFSAAAMLGYTGMPRYISTWEMVSRGFLP